MNEERILDMKKIAIVTGGNKGIGLEVTKSLLTKDYKVYVIARDFSNFSLSSKENVKQVVFDITDIEGIKPLVKDIVSKEERIDLLVNNAGIMNSIPYDNYPQADMDRLMKVNLYAPMEFINQVSDPMIKSGTGRIVNTASIAGEIGHPDVWYGVSKAGIINATKSFATILGPKGIVINAVAPGPVKTDMLYVIPEARKEKIKSSVFTGRFAEAEEVAKAIVWLAEECPEYINGTCIDINNGAFLR